jgi:type II secretory pathway component GspD/PulD (secretin)
MISKSAIVRNALLLTLISGAPTLSASAQTASESPKAAVSDSPATKPASPPSTRSDPDSWPVHTFYLKNSDSQATLNDDVTILRNTIARDSQINVVFSQNAIVTRVNPSEIPKIEKILSDIDRPKKTYRTTYTVTEVENGMHPSIQHFALVAFSGQETRLREGNKVPVAARSYTTGVTSGDHPSPGTDQTEFTYVDVGINLDQTLNDTGSSTAILKYSIERSGVALNILGPDTRDVTVRTASLAGEATLSPGKSLLLGSLDIPGRMGHLDIEVLMEPLP